MKYRLVTAILFCIVFFPFSLLRSEDVLRPFGRSGSPGNYTKLSTSIGIEAGANFNDASQNLSWLPDFVRSPQRALGKGDGISPFICLFIDFPLKSKMGIEIKAGYDAKLFESSSNSLMDYDVLNDRLMVSNNLRTKPLVVEGNLTIKSDVNYNYKSTFTFLTVSPLFYYEIISGLRLYVGPAFQIPIGKGVTEKNYSIINSYFPGGKKSVSMSETNTLKIRAGAEIGISYEFRLTDNLTVAPVARYQWMLTKFEADYLASDPPAGINADIKSVLIVEPSQLNSFQAGLRFKWKI